MGPNKHQHNKNMLRYKTKTRPGLVALYDIRPGNGAGPFLQPRSPHGALPMNGFPLEFGIGARGPKCFYDGATNGRKSFKIGLVVLIQYRL